MRTVAAALACAALLTAWPSAASANGRFPESNALFFTPSDPNLVILRVTFGLVVSHDRGQTWDWVCEPSLHLSGIEDPMVTVTPNGTYVASVFQGLSISRDRACSFQLEGGDLKDLVFIDLTTRAAEPKRVLTLSSAYDGDDNGTPYYKTLLFESQDEASTFTKLPPVFDPSLLAYTVDLAPSDPERIYVSAVRDPGLTPTAFLLTSYDHGKTYEEHSFPLEGTERDAYIAAVDPTNADRVYVRTTNAIDKPGRLAVTDDAGKTWKTVFTGVASLPGFALSDDGTKVYVGGPKDGVQVANTSDFAFTQRSTIEIGCLKLASDGLWACSTEKSGFVAGISTDDGATFEKKVRFCDIRGALTASCSATSSAATECVAGWPVQQAGLGCGFLDGGSGTPSGDGGADGGATGEGDPSDDGGCAVRRPESGSLASLSGIAVAAVLAVACARRGRRARH